MNVRTIDDLFVNGLLSPKAFESDIHLTDVLNAVARTQAGSIESTHFLIALGAQPKSKALAHIGDIVTPEQWQSGLSSCIQPGMTLPPEYLARDKMDATALRMLQDALFNCDEYQVSLISSTNLMLSALRNLTPAVSELFADAGMDVDEWRQKLAEDLIPPAKLELFLPDGSLDKNLFTNSGEKILHLLVSESSAMGYEKADPRHLLLALLIWEGSSMQYGLYLQGKQPRKIQESVTLNLQAGAKRTPSGVSLDLTHLQPVLQGILLTAAELCSRQRAKQISEPHLTQAFLTEQSIARRILEDEQVNLLRLLEVSEKYEVSEEEIEEATLADIETVRSRLFSRLVGQEDAIQKILPYVQRMRFGFTIPGKPVGVFLFCGQSGSGKTEMAKELARSVYGSEENLIFLEMGQFNAPESMNIFVGAPPGYIGYGEGKLTNGLRDKPRSVVLFDEVEKAHVRVLDALLRFLDEGQIDDPAGPVRDGSQCIIILTSNVGAEELSKLSSELQDNPEWRKELRARLRDEFKKHNFRVEFLNRVDEVILFNTLTTQDYTEIARRQLSRILSRLQAEKGVTISVDDQVLSDIGRYCGQINEGARATMRMIQFLIVTPVISFLLENNIPTPASVRVQALLVGDDAEPATQVVSG